MAEAPREGSRKLKGKVELFLSTASRRGERWWGRGLKYHCVPA